VGSPDWIDKGSREVYEETNKGKENALYELSM
jgi:hypothetical protein